MRDQIVELSSRLPYYPQHTEHYEMAPLASYPDGAFWLKVYPPLGDRKAPVPDGRMICPWNMAAELVDPTTPSTRRQNILEALKKGLKTIRQYQLPACRILFAEDHVTRVISVWVD